MCSKTKWINFPHGHLKSSFKSSLKINAGTLQVMKAIFPKWFWLKPERVVHLCHSLVCSDRCGIRTSFPVGQICVNPVRLVGVQRVCMMVVCVLSWRVWFDSPLVSWWEVINLNRALHSCCGGACMYVSGWNMQTHNMRNVRWRGRQTDPY